MPETLGQSAYGSLVDLYQRTNPGVGLSTNADQDKFNNWTGGIMSRFGVGSWEELPSNFEQGIATDSALNIATGGAFGGALSNFDSLVKSFGGDAVSAPRFAGGGDNGVEKATPLEPTTPPPNNGAIVPTDPTVPNRGDDIISAITMLLARPKEPATITTIAPTNVSSTAINANPEQVIVPVMQQASGMFAGLLSGFDSLVAKVTMTRQTEPNANNTGLIAAGAEARPQYLMNPISSLSGTNAPSGTAATISGLSKPASVLGGSGEIPWGMISVGLGIIGLLIIFLRRGK
jgi:hypothetical protein